MSCFGGSGYRLSAEFCGVEALGFVESRQEVGVQGFQLFTEDRDLNPQQTGHSVEGAQGQDLGLQSLGSSSGLQTV